MFRNLIKYVLSIGFLLLCTSIFSQDTIPWFVGDTSYNEMLSQAILFQERADSLMTIAYEHRKEIMFLDDSERKGRLQVEVTKIEREAKQLQSWADDLFSNLPVPEEEVVETSFRDSLIILDTVINDIKVYHYNLEAFREPENTDEVTTKNDEPEPGKGLKVEGNHFQIHKESPYSAENPFEHSFILPGGPFYRIQLAAYGNPVGYDFFGGISPITTEVTEKGITRYYAGKFVSFDAAENAINQLRAVGYNDAFLVGYFNGQRMATERVLEYEKNLK
jgi:hypothetical protein